MQSFIVIRKEIRIPNPSHAVVEEELFPEAFTFTITDADAIENCNELEFYLQYRNRKGEYGMEVLDKTMQGNSLLLSWKPSAMFTKERGRTEIQIFGVKEEFVLTADLEFKDKQYYAKDDDYIPLVLKASQSEGEPYIGQNIAEFEAHAQARIYEIKRYNRWSTLKTYLVLGENIQGDSEVVLPDTRYVEDSIMRMKHLVDEAETVVQEAVEHAQIPIQHVTNLRFMSREEALDILNGTEGE